MGVSGLERAVWCGVLVVLFLGSVVWIVGSIVLGWPLGTLQAVALILVAGAAVSLFSAYYLPEQLDVRVKRAATVGAGCIALIAAVLAVPALQGRPDQPLTATLTVGFNECEHFAVPAELLPSVSSQSEIDPQWVYENNGASTTRLMNLIVQGTTEDSVLIQGLNVVNVETQDPPPSVVNLLPCEPPRLATVPTRYFEVDLSNPPRITPLEVKDPAEEPVPVPWINYKVSSTEPEFFQIFVVGPACFCSWQLELEWIRGGRTGKTVVDRGFGKIRTNTGPDARRIEYSREEDGTWDPPLPK